MRGPIFHVGCFKACFGVTEASCEAGVLRKGPPEAVRISFTASVADSRPQALMCAVVFAVHRDQRYSVFPCRVHNKFSAGHENLFICKANRFAVTDRLVRGFQPRDTHNRRKYKINLGGNRNLHSGFRPESQFRPLRFSQSGRAKTIC